MVKVHVCITWTSGCSYSFLFRLALSLLIMSLVKYSIILHRGILQCLCYWQIQVSCYAVQLMPQISQWQTKILCIFQVWWECFVAAIHAGIISFKTCNKEEIVNTSVLYLKSLSTQILNTDIKPKHSIVWCHCCCTR